MPDLVTGLVPPPAHACDLSAPAAMPMCRSTPTAARRIPRTGAASGSVSWLLGTEFIATTPHGEDARGLGRVFFDLRPQAIDVGVDRVFVTFVAVTPDRVEQVHARENLARLAGEEIQQVELPWREVHTLSVEADFAGDRIDGQAIEAQTAGVHLQIACHGIDTTQQGFDPSHQFEHRKRLGKVIVGAQFQTKDAVQFAGAGAGDDNRCVTRHRPGTAADFQTVDPRQHQVEDECIPVTLLQQAHALVAVGAVCDLELFVPQMQANQVGDVLVILDHKDAFGLFHEAQSFGAISALCGFSSGRVITNSLTPREDLAINPSLGCVP
ncbi:hypothetical protein EMIT0P265_50394 [Pseudomonas zeae]